MTTLKVPRRKKKKKIKMLCPQHFSQYFYKKILSNKLLQAVIDGKKIILVVGSN